MKYSIPHDALRHLKLLRQFEEALRLQPGTSLGEFWADFTNKEKMGQGESPLSPAVLLMQLYARLVFPWESLKRQVRKKESLKKVPAQEWGRFSILNLEPALARRTLTVDMVLEILRNAVAHARVKVDSRGQITFSVRGGTKLRFGREGLESFLDRLGEEWGSGVVGQ